MKILQTSNIHLGRYFEGQYMAGDRLRAELKSNFARIIEAAKNNSVDMILFAGDIFDSVDVSQNLLDFFISEIEKIGNTSIVIFPGINDKYEKGSFWDFWKVKKPVDNLYVLAEEEISKVEIPNLSTVIYSMPSYARRASDNPLRDESSKSQYDNHIAVIIGDSIASDEDDFNPLSIKLDADSLNDFDYLALGGSEEFESFIDRGHKASYSGSPFALSPGLDKAGNLALVEINSGNVTVTPVKIDGFTWDEIEISLDTIISHDDLKAKIAALADKNRLLNVRLTGLALLEAGCNIDILYEELTDLFLSLEIIDNTRVLPSNVSEVKVQEKTIIGQYLKVMVNKLNEADEGLKEELEESLKVGYSLISGKKAW